MPNIPAIRDTSGQDTPLTRAAVGRQRLRLWLWLSIALVIMLAGLVWIVRGWEAGTRSHDGSRLRIAEVRRGDLVRDISADGRVIAANSPTLFAIAGGTVTLHVVSGDVVGHGQALAEIDSPQLRSELAQAEATLASMRAEADRAVLDASLARAAARNALERARIEQVAANRELERHRRGFETGVVAEIDLAAARDNLEKADIVLALADEDYQLQDQGADLDIRNRQLLAERQQAVVNELQRQVAALTLRAPFDGQVGQVQVAQRSYVAANAPVLTVVDLSVFEVEIRIPESFARDLAIGMPGEIRSGRDLLPAEVSAVSAEVVNGEVAARLRFSEGQPPALRQNQRLSARILIDSRANVLLVDRGPFLEHGGGRFAYVVYGNRAERRAMRFGTTSLGAVEILEGASEGDRVVISGSQLFNNAERVRISGD